MFKLTVFIFVMFVVFGDSQLVKTTLPPIRPILFGVPPVLCSKICIAPVNRVIGPGGECECKDSAGVVRPVSDMDVRKSRITCEQNCIHSGKRYSNYPKFGEACQCLAQEPNFAL